MIPISIRENKYWTYTTPYGILHLAVLFMTLPGFHDIDRMTVCSYEAGQRGGPSTLQILPPIVVQN